MDKVWSVSVNGEIVSESLLTFDEAVNLEWSYLEQGYENIKLLKNGEEQ